MFLLWPPISRPLLRLKFYPIFSFVITYRFSIQRIDLELFSGRRKIENAQRQQNSPVKLLFESIRSLNTTTKIFIYSAITGIRAPRVSETLPGNQAATKPGGAVECPVNFQLENFGNFQTSGNGNFQNENSHKLERLSDL